MARLSLALLLMLAAASPRAENQPASRTGANTVRLDMYATRDGQSVDDLQASDVDVLEDGVPQTIESLEHVKVGSPGSTRARVFVIFLDTQHSQIEGSSNMRVPLIKFLDRVVGQDDMVAVMTPEMSAKEMTFGGKTTVISNIMQSDWAWARRGRTERRDQKEALYDACYARGSNSSGLAGEMKARRREKMTLDALDDLVAHLGGIREERKAILTVSDGWVLFRENKDLLASQKQNDQSGLVDRLLRRPTKEKSEETGAPKDVNFVECEADRVALAALDHSLRLRSLTDEANRSNTSFYSIEARAIAASDAAASPEKPAVKRDATTNVASRQDSLRFIADNTDGLLIASSNNLDSQIGRIVDDVSSYYLVTYSSTNTKLDGRMRAVTVRVKRDGIKVRARRGYRGRTADDLISGGTSGSGDRVSATATPATGPNTRAQFRIRTSTWLRESSEDGRPGAFWVVGELDYQTRRQLAWTAGAEAEVVVLAADGTEVVSRKVDLKADDGPFSIQVPESGGIAPGEYAVRVRIRSEADEKIELTDTARVVLGEGAGLGEAVMWRRGPSTGPRYLRTADPRFSRSDRLRLELATSAATPAKARMLDRNRNELSVPAQVTERDDPSGTFRWIVIDVALAPFAAGDYAVEVTQGRQKRITEFKLVP